MPSDSEDEDNHATGRSNPLQSTNSADHDESEDEEPEPGDAEPPSEQLAAVQVSEDSP